MEPIVLEANQPPQFYRGGKQITAFRRGDPAALEQLPEGGPEDWVASTVRLHGADAAGLTHLADGRTLASAIVADPHEFLSPEHIALWGSSPALLVKLLDPAQRLPVHCHPNRGFAQLHLHSQFGKTEAWIVLAVDRPDATVYLGFREDVSDTVLRRWFVEQSEATMLSALNAITVSAGDAILVPAGAPHAIGPGILLVELQEPTDFSVMLEWKSFGLPDRQSRQLGLDQTLALQCVDRTAYTADKLADCLRHAEPDAVSSPLFSAAADPFFTADWLSVRASTSLPAGYSVLVVTSGGGEVVTARSRTAVSTGATLLIPFSAGEVELRGTFGAIRCLPPTVQ